MTNLRNNLRRELHISIVDGSAGAVQTMAVGSGPVHVLKPDWTGAGWYVFAVENGSSPNYYTQIQQEIQRHDWTHFVDEPPAIAQGGRGVVVPRCPVCRKRINTMSNFLDSPCE
jgi:hypothetical protein